MDKKEFAMRLARLRAKKNVSAREMSLSIGQNASYINNIETCKARPSLEVFFYICDYLGITPAQFFDTEASDPTKLDSIVKDLKKLNDHQLESIATIIKGLIK